MLQQFVVVQTARASQFKEDAANLCKVSRTSGHALHQRILPLT